MHCALTVLAGWCQGGGRDPGVDAELAVDGRGDGLIVLCDTTDHQRHRWLELRNITGRIGFLPNSPVTPHRLLTANESGATVRRLSIVVSEGSP